MLQKELGNGEEGCADNGTDGESNAEEQLQGGTGRKGEKPVHERNVQQEGKDDGGRRLQDDGDDDIGGCLLYTSGHTDIEFNAAGKPSVAQA